MYTNASGLKPGDVVRINSIDKGSPWAKHADIIEGELWEYTKQKTFIATDKNVNDKMYSALGCGENEINHQVQIFLLKFNYTKC